MRPDVMRLAALALAALALASCGPTPKPFEHEAADDVAFHPKRDKNDVIIATPANMPGKLADKIATALALELQSYDIVAAVQPAQAPLKVAGATSTRDAGFGLGIEIQIEWYLLGSGGNMQGPAVSKTVARPEDIAEGNDRLVSRIAQQAAPRIATLMGKPPSVEARAPGQVAAGSTDLPPAQQQLMEQGWVQWGTDQQQYLMGLYSGASAFGVIDGYRYPTIRTGEGPLLKADLDRVKKRTAIWQAKAKAYGDIQ